MDRITLDLLKHNHITQRQIDRLVSHGVHEDTVLYTLIKVGAVSANFVKRFIVEQIKTGKYDINILKNYQFIKESEVLQALGEALHLSFVDLDSIDMDYKLAERVPLNQLKKYNLIQYRSTRSYSENFPKKTYKSSDCDKQTDTGISV